jgi:WD40 repeat protein/serine/threonine protein kinase
MDEVPQRPTQGAASQTRDPERLRALVAECLERMEIEGESAIEALCTANPNEAAGIRKRLRSLQNVGLLDGAAADPGSPPERLGDFRLLRKLGEGGMGVVYLAEQVSLGRKVALKLVRPGHLLFGGTRERFQREIEAVARLQHPGVVPIYMVGEEQGIPYFAMEHVAGCSVADVLLSLAGRNPGELSGRSLAAAIAERSHDSAEPNYPRAASGYAFEGSWTDACFRLARQVAEALEHAHRRGVVHRDLKPSNLMVTAQGRVLLLDFGLAATRESHKLTRTGAQLGSLPYLSPEQVRGDSAAIDVRTDVYGLGVTLYEMLTLRVPYGANTNERLMQQILEGHAEPPRRFNSQLSWDAETVCLTAMEADPARRYASAADLARDIDNVLHLRPIEARRPSRWLRLRRWAQRHPGRAVGIAAGSLLLVGGPIVYGLQERGFGIQQKAINAQLADALDRSIGVRLLAQASSQLSIEPGRALLLAIEGARRHPGLLANETLLTALAVNPEEHQLSGHPDGVANCDFSPDGRLVATSCNDGLARVFDVATGKLAMQFAGHHNSVRSVAFDAAGARLLTSSYDGTARIFDVASGRSLVILRGHRAHVHWAAWSPDGERVATVSQDTCGRIWNARTGECIAELKGHTKELGYVEFSPDGTRLVTVPLDAIGDAGVTGDHTIRVWDAQDGRLLWTLEGHTRAVVGAHFSPDSRKLVSCSKDPNAVVWDARTGDQLAVLRGHVTGIAVAEFSRDGERILTASSDHTLRLWDANTYETKVLMTGHDRAMRFAALSPDRKLVASGGDDRTVRLWDAESGAQVGVSSAHQWFVWFARFSADSKHLATASGDARLWRVPAGSQLSGWPAKEISQQLVSDAEASPDGASVAMVCADASVRLRSAASGGELARLAGHGGAIARVGHDPAGGRLVTASRDGTARVWDRASGRELANISAEGRKIVAARFADGGASLVTAWSDKSVRTIDWESGRETGAFTGAAAALADADASADGKLVLGAARDGTLLVWNRDGGKLASTFADPKKTQPRGAAFDASGERILEILNDGSVRLVRWKTNEITLAIAGPGQEIFDAALSPDGRLVAIACADRTARLYSAATGLEVSRFTQHQAIVARVAFIDGGRAVRSVSLDGVVHTWPVDALAAAIERAPRQLRAEERIEFEVGDASLWKSAKELVGKVAIHSATWRRVAQTIAADATLAPELREAALAVARETLDNPRTLSEVSSATTRSPGRTPQEYAAALEQAERACELAPEVGPNIRAVAMAQYRCGKYAECVETAARADALSSQAVLRNRPFDALVRAMALQKLGRAGEAKEALEEVRRRAEILPKDSVFFAMLEEADALILGIVKEKPATNPSKG